MRRHGERGVIMLTVVFFLMFFGLSLNFYRLAVERKYISAAAERSYITIHGGDSQGTIYDRNFKPFTNENMVITAVAVPSAVDLKTIEKIAEDKEKATADYKKGDPFAFVCTKKVEESAGLTFFEVPRRYGDEVIAPHVIGYLSDGEGASGIEYAFDTMLRTGNIENSVTYSTDGFGHILIGEGKSVIRSNKAETGVVLTLDSEIQKICEEAGENIEKGVIIVSDVKNGEILGLASFPDYDVENIAASLENENSPMINRAFYSYSVGSIFKLVTACEGINEGFGGYVDNCTGSYEISEQKFACHKHEGHGSENMTEAMTNSCNPYFISLSRCLDVQAFRDLAFSLGFGREIHLCAGMISSAGVLPTANELLVPAELANFSFGQGKLTATPLQINQMTCAIANGGELIMMRLVKGITVDGETVGNEKLPQKSRAISSDTAKEIRELMTAAVRKSENSNADAIYTQTAAKTSTAQTGRFDEKGEEYCHGWVTGFFPASSPRYAITVLVEDGGYGNDTAAPIFREIVDTMCK